MSLIWFWFVCAAMTAAVLAIFAKTMRRAVVDQTEDAADLAIYRDQLAEVNSEVERGVLEDADAEHVRLEISRRMLDADRRTGGDKTAKSGPDGMAPILALVVLIGFGGGAGYMTLGAPGYGDTPLAKRIADAQEYRSNRPAQATLEAARQDPGQPDDLDPQIANLMAQLRVAVAERPGDQRGLELLAQQEANFGNFIAASRAHTQLVALRGDTVTPDELAQNAFFMINAAGGNISPEAEAVLIALLNRDPENPLGIYYSGLMFAQVDRPDMAFRLWRGLAESGLIHPFVDLARANIVEAAFLAGIDYNLPDRSRRGPSAEDIAAAEDLTDEERSDMIRLMVTGLENRLASEGGPVSEWVRLIRAYGVLGDTARASIIWNEAREVFAQNPQAVSTLSQAARDAGAVN